MKTSSYAIVAILFVLGMSEMTPAHAGSDAGDVGKALLGTAIIFIAVDAMTDDDHDRRRGYRRGYRGDDRHHRGHHHHDHNHGYGHERFSPNRSNREIRRYLRNMPR